MKANRTEKEIIDFVAKVNTVVNTIPFSSDARKNSCATEIKRLYSTYNDERLPDELERYVSNLVKQSAILPSDKNSLMSGIMSDIIINRVKGSEELVKQYMYDESDDITPVHESVGVEAPKDEVESESQIVEETAPTFENVADGAISNPDNEKSEEDILDFIDKNRQETDKVLNLSPESEEKVKELLNSNTPTMEFVPDGTVPTAEEIKKQAAEAQAAREATTQSTTTTEKSEPKPTKPVQKKSTLEKVKSIFKVASLFIGGFGVGYIAAHLVPSKDKNSK